MQQLSEQDWGDISLWKETVIITSHSSKSNPCKAYRIISADYVSKTKIIIHKLGHVKKIVAINKDSPDTENVPPQNIDLSLCMHVNVLALSA